MKSLSLLSFALVLFSLVSHANVIDKAECVEKDGSFFVEATSSSLEKTSSTEALEGTGEESAKEFCERLAAEFIEACGESSETAKESKFGSRTHEYIKALACSFLFVD